MRTKDEKNQASMQNKNLRDLKRTNDFIASEGSNASRNSSSITNQKITGTTDSAAMQYKNDRSFSSTQIGKAKEINKRKTSGDFGDVNYPKGNSSSKPNSALNKIKVIKETLKRERKALLKKSDKAAQSLAQTSRSMESNKSIFDYPSSAEEDKEEIEINDDVDFSTATVTDALISIEPFSMPDLSEDQELLFQIVRKGENIRLKSMISQMDFLTLNGLSTIRNVEGETLFHTAVRFKNKAVVSTLLSDVPNLEKLLYDILLVAVNFSDEDIATQILRAIKSNTNLQVVRGGLCDLPRWEHSMYGRHMTPLMMAAIVGDYNLIALFAAEGEQLDPKLTYNSRTGRITKKGTTEDSEDFNTEICSEDIMDDYQRLHEFQALTSPEMLCFLASTTKEYDPLLKCFHYIKDLKFVQSREIEFRDNYQELIDKLTKFSIQLVSMCESSQELDLFFSKSEGKHGRHDRYPRIVMAVEMGLKEFVSHPHTQTVLYNQWAGQDWHEWRYFSKPSKFQQLANRVLFIPAILFSIFLDQGGAQGKLLSCPLHRCLYSGISHCVFLMLAITEHVLESSQPNERMPANFFIEIALALIIAGKFRALLRQFCFSPYQFYKILWNWYEIIYCCLFCVSFTCWFLLHFPITREYRLRRKPLERQYWKANDLLMIADVFLALGTIMACGQLLRYVQLHNKIGPIQIALGEMLKSFANFALFFLVILSSFTLGITAIYAPYKGMKNSVTGEQQQDVFTRHSSTLQEMYWDLFGGADPSSAELITISVTDPDNPGETEQYEHYITEITGKLLYSVYSFFGPTILFSSILIGFISRTFGNILEENDINWRFHRAQIWLYFARASVMPPPFNLIPSLWDITNFFRTIQDVKGHPRKYFVTCNCASCFHLDTNLTPEDREKQEENYFNLIKLLIRRYFRLQRSLDDEQTVSCEDINILSKEVQYLSTLAGQMGLQCSAKSSSSDLEEHSSSFGKVPFEKGKVLQPESTGSQRQSAVGSKYTENTKPIESNVVELSSVSVSKGSTEIDEIKEAKLTTPEKRSSSLRKSSGENTTINSGTRNSSINGSGNASSINEQNHLNTPTCAFKPKPKPQLAALPPMPPPPLSTSASEEDQNKRKGNKNSL